MNPVYFWLFAVFFAGALTAAIAHYQDRREARAIRPTAPRFPQWSPGNTVYLYRIAPRIERADAQTHQYISKCEMGLTDTEILETFGPGKYMAVLVVAGRPDTRATFTLEAKCRFCEKTPSDAYSASMGMYCENSPKGKHSFGMERGE